jgi:hypothetical protein
MLVRQGKEQPALELGAPQIPHWNSFDLLLACARQRPASETLPLAAMVRPSGDPETDYLFATHLAYCGESQAAISMLKGAIRSRYCSYPAMDSEPYFSKLQATAGFAEARAAGQGCQRDFLAATQH